MFEYLRTSPGVMATVMVKYVSTKLTINLARYSDQDNVLFQCELVKGLCKVKKIKKSEITLEVSGW